MSQLDQVQSSGAVDKAMLAGAVLALLAGIVAFHSLAESSVWLRAGVLIAGIVIGLVVALMSQSGRRFIGFSQHAIDETRKVVWPTRKETIQTTLIVFAFVLVMAIFLWFADKLLEWVLYDLLLGWKR
ncbi:MAG: preprotein translocase subunit SecE [Betaproteobacteria bacterium]|nr:preprotein translocase subunit SecE [Betaproteobacteria bacterium]